MYTPTKTPNTLSVKIVQDFFKDINKKGAPVLVVIDNKEDIVKIRNVFRGSGNLILSNFPDRYYKATVVSKLDFERVIRQFHTVLITFKLQPHAYELKDSIIKLTNTNKSYTLENKTNATSQPLITIHGSGTAIIVVGNETIMIKNINIFPFYSWLQIMNLVLLWKKQTQNIL